LSFANEPIALGLVIVTRPMAGRYSKLSGSVGRPRARRIMLIIEHSGEIVEMILERIRNADVVIADITHGNPNVQYEVGVAHANHTPTILIMRAGAEIPFDLRGFNIILYENVTRLRDALKRRLEVILKLADQPQEPE